MQMRWLLSTLLLTSLETGCASMFVDGGKLADHDYATDSKADYVSPTCTNVATGAASDGTTATYHLVLEQGRPAVFERSKNGKGVVATNRWTASDGDHYLAWVKQSGARDGDGFLTGLFRSEQTTGFEYVVPPEGAGTRRIYNDLKVVKGEDGVTKPTSAPTFSCPLTPIPKT